MVGLQELRTDYKEFQERRKLRDGESDRQVYIYQNCDRARRMGSMVDSFPGMIHSCTTLNTDVDTKSHHFLIV